MNCSHFGSTSDSCKQYTIAAIIASLKVIPANDSAKSPQTDLLIYLEKKLIMLSLKESNIITDESKNIKSVEHPLLLLEGKCKVFLSFTDMDPNSFLWRDIWNKALISSPCCEDFTKTIKWP